jgi:hypothetical protein
MAEFTASLTYPNGRVAQVGDNDSGRFLKLWPAITKWDADAGCEPHEDHLDHRHLLAAAAGLGVDFSRPHECGHYEQGIWQTSPETILVRQLTDSTGDVSGSEPSMPSSGDATGRLGQRLRCPRRSPLEPGASRTQPQPHHSSSRAFPDFGVYVLRRGRWILVFRCGSVGQNGRGGHAHNDQLSIELCVDGTPVIVDTGTYLYTPIPRFRNQFRSTGAHNTLTLDGHEQNDWPRGGDELFRLPDRAQARILQFAEDEIVAEHVGFGLPHRRRVRITDEAILGEDHCTADAAKQVLFHLAGDAEVVQCDPAGGLVVRCRKTRIRLTATDGPWSVERGDYSAGYGEIVATNTGRLAFPGTSLSWRIEAL